MATETEPIMAAETMKGAGLGKIIVTLPAYNEEQNIATLLETISANLQTEGLPFEILVVEDGSTDRTMEILRDYQSKLPLTVHPHPKNQGLGPTIRDGLQLASERGSPDDIVVTLDADNSHNPGLIRLMVGRIREGHDIVIASRYQPGARVVGLAPEAVKIGQNVKARVELPGEGSVELPMVVFEPV